MKYLFFVIVTLCVNFPALAAKPDYVVMAQRRETVSYRGQVYLRDSFWVVDIRSQREFAVSIINRGQDWVGSSVKEYKVPAGIESGHYSTPFVKANPTDTQNVLMALGKTFESSGRTVEKPNDERDRGETNPPGKQRAQLDLKPSRGGPKGEFTFPSAVYSPPSAQEYNRERFLQNFNASYAEQMSRSRYDVDQHYAQQEALRQAEQSARDQASQVLNNHLQAEHDANARQKADMLYMFYLSESAANQGGADPFAGESRLDSIILDSAGIEYLNKQMATDLSGQWQYKAEIAATLTNPWTGIPGSQRSLTYADAQGVLKGPLFAPNSIHIRELAKKDPVLAHELTRTANALQAYAADQPVIFKGAKNTAVMESAVAMLRLATETGLQTHADAARALANYFTGMAMDVKMSVADEDGVKKFVSRGSMNSVIRERDGAKQIAQAVHYALTSNLTWMNGANASTIVQREAGSAYSVEAAMAAYLKPGMKNPQAWINGARQSYPLSAPPNLTFKSTEVQSAFNSVAAQTSSPMALGETARQGAFSAFKIADDIIKFGDSETGKQWIQYGRMIADVGLGFVPFVGVGLDVYAIATGTNLITGEKLSMNERLISAVSLATMGYGGRIYGAYKAARGLKIAGEAGHFMPTLNKALNKVERLSNNDMNAILRKSFNYTEDSWKIGGRASRFQLPEKSIGDFSRVYSDLNKAEGMWIVESKLIEGKTAMEIKQMLRIPGPPPKYVSKLDLPEGETLVRGFLNHRAFENPADKVYRKIGDRVLEIKPQPRVQYFLENPKTEYFRKGVELP